MKRRLPIAIRLTRFWVGLYTGGLSPTIREERRAELESDIWEHSQAPGVRPSAILARCLLGIPADLSWRLEHARPGGVVVAMFATAVGRMEASADWVGRKGLPGLTLLGAWLYLLAGALLLATLPVSRNPNPGGVAVLAVWCLLAGGLIWWGHATFASRPLRGASFIVLGSLPIGLALYMTVVIPLATIAVCSNTAHRAWRACNSPPPGPLVKRKVSSYYSPRWPAPLHSPAPGVRSVFAKILNAGDSLLSPVHVHASSPSRRRYLLTGGGVGLTLGILGRIWMRTISNDPRFTVGGTGLIFIVFTGLGVLTGLSLAWRRFGTNRRRLVVRAVAWAPFLLMGPFMLLFIPGLELALVRTRASWRRWQRRALTWSAFALLAFLVLIFLGADHGPGIVAASLYLVLAWALYFTNRLALTIPGRPGVQSSGPGPNRPSVVPGNTTGAGAQPA